MARLPQIVDLIAEHDTRDRATIELMARGIREAGHIATTKRGRGAAPMTARDAANLLIGVASTESPTLAPIEVGRKRSLRRHLPTRHGNSFVPDAFLAFDRAETFGEAIEALIEDARLIDATIQQFVRRTYHSQGSIPAEAMSMLADLEITLNERSAEIVFFHSDSGKIVDYRAAYVVDSDLFVKGFYGGGKGSFRRVAVTFNFSIIRALADAINPDSPS